ncbi:hypothetical protein ECBG_00491 [Enterococcus casseliflavus EC20]|uniref:Glycosyl transferase family 1 domain-containing protein n=1 Tax=Enterococcus casseliflavus EC20 TaxID=565655 RepID=C9A6W1_ENTCA|nr:glycosyltransferase family 4 protein [Enterococcus casseliflavus]EEV38222.1 hypothetical protein ECBG_00491 [Enterococcus casseliflavus EC20]
MKHIFIISNNDVGLYKFRKEVISAFLDRGYRVSLCLPYGKYIDYFLDLGCEFYDIEINRRGTSIIQDFKLLKNMYKYINKLNPDIVLTFTIKPNIYGGIASLLNRKLYVANITGLGTALGNASHTQKILTLLYKLSFYRIKTVFFQNNSDFNFFKQNHISNPEKYKILPGSGVNLNQIKKLDYPEKSKTRFLFISRIMYEKGIDNYLETAQVIKEEYDDVEFHICGFLEEDYKEKLLDLVEKGIVIYHGMIDDVESIFNIIHCTIHPSFYPEGLSNVLLESCAYGRPIITTDNPGCREIVDKNKSNGFIVNKNNTEELVQSVRDFMDLSYRDKEIMGKNGRKFVEENFSRDIVVEKYLEEIDNIH